MKKQIGKILYLLLMFAVGICLIIGGFINIQNNSTYLVIVGSFAIGIGAIIIAIKEFIKVLRARAL